MPVHVQELQIIQFGVPLLEAHFTSEQRPSLDAWSAAIAALQPRTGLPGAETTKGEMITWYQHARAPTEAKWGNWPRSRADRSPRHWSPSRSRARSWARLARTVLGTCDLARGIDEPASAVREIFNLLRNSRPH